MSAVAPAGELALKAALSPWERRLALQSLERGLIFGAILALVMASLVLLVGWVAPVAESDLRPWAAQIALVPLVLAAIVALWPRRHLRNAALLDTRLRFADRLATAWAFRAAEDPITRLQRDNALQLLRRRSPRTDLRWSPTRPEVIALGAAAFVTLLLLITPSPQQRVLDRQVAEDLAVQQTSQRLEVVRQQAEASASLTPDQVRQLDELLQQAQSELNQVHTQQEATNVLARAQDQLAQQLADPNAELRDEALAAMSETLAAEPQTQPLADALQREDAQATTRAIQDLSARADQLSDVERQSLSRALQRAANVGRSDPGTSNALRDASQALASNASPQAALSQADAAMQQSIQASQSQAALNATLQQLREMQTRLASGKPVPGDEAQGALSSNPDASSNPLSGTPVALSSAGSNTLAEPSSAQGDGAGPGPSTNTAQAQSAPAAPPAENVFVPGRASSGSGDQLDSVDQPFTIRGAPRPYRDVLNQYAQSSRDYVDRPDISPAVRDLVKQYFQGLESDQ